MQTTAVPSATRSLRSRPRVSCTIILIDNANGFVGLKVSEKQIEISLGDGLTVNERIDLTRPIDSGETNIVDHEVTERAQDEDVTEAQAYVYALGHQQLTGQHPSHGELCELGERNPDSVHPEVIADVETQVPAEVEAPWTSTRPSSPRRNKRAGRYCQGMRRAARDAAG